MQENKSHYFNVAKLAAQLRDIRVVRQKDGELTQFVLLYGGSKMAKCAVDVDAAVLWLAYFYPTAQVVDLDHYRIIVNLPKE